MKTSELIYNINRAMENDREAIEALYNYTYAGMYSLAYRLCRNKDAADDILQESYIAAFSGLNTLQYKGEFWKWLKGIVINKWRDYSKKNMIFSDALDYDSAEELVALEHPKMTTQERLENEEKNRELWRLVNELPEKQRICIILFYYENMSVDEIAESLKIPVGSVKSRLHYGREKLKNIMQGNDLFAGAALSSSIAGAQGVNAKMLTQILAALEAGSKGSAAVIAAKTAGGGLLLKLGVGLASLVTVAGVICGGILLHGDATPNLNPIASAASITTRTTTSTTAPMNTTPTTTSTQSIVTTTAPAKTATFDYRVIEGGIMIEKYTGTAQNVVIPDKIEGQSVVSIGLGAFKDCLALKSVSIPGSVVSIESNAFRECTNLTSVTLHGGLNTIGDMAFLGCSSLKSVKIPSSVRIIGIYAFAYCTSLRSAEISEGTHTVNYCAFYKCPNLRKVVLPGTVGVIGKDAFADAHDEIVLCVKEGTYSHNYALDNGFNFEFAD